MFYFVRIWVHPDGTFWQTSYQPTGHFFFDTIISLDGQSHFLAFKESRPQRLPDIILARF
jgi:hypothetical protein